MNRLLPAMPATLPRLLLVLALLCACSPASADTALVRGPYLQTGTPNSVVLRWRTSTLSDSKVLYGSAPGSLGQVKSSTTLLTDHSITLTGLNPDTRYYYAIGSSTATLAGDDADHFFVTAPLPGTARPSRIWVIGDSGTAGDSNHTGKAQAVADAYMNFTGNTHTDLWLMLGDNAYPSGTDSEYQTAVFDVYNKMLWQSVLWSTFGNHDGISADSATQSGPYYDIFTLPRSAEAGGIPSGTEAYYSFDYGNIHFICLDSQESNTSVNGPMVTWLQEDLSATSQQWIIAFWHHPPYTKGSHDSDTEQKHINMRQNVLPILEQAGVDLVLGGHSHSYERSFLINGHYGLSTTFNNSMKIDGGDGRIDGSGAYKANLPAGTDGAVYIVAGSSGSTGGGSLNHPAMYISLNELGSLVLDIDSNRLDATFLNQAGTARDHFSIIKPVDACSSVWNPSQPDHDNDGIIDSCDPDDDNDGLPDTVELTLGTDPFLADTDGDTLSDYDEVNYDGNPATYSYGADLDPLKKDTDNDGINDNLDTLLRFTYRVAASDSDDQDKSRADFVCDGIDDQVEINAAISALPSLGGDILLDTGHYQLNILAGQASNGIYYGINLPDNIRLAGTGQKSTILHTASTQTASGITIFIDDAHNTLIENLQLDGDWQSGNNLSTMGIGIREGNGNSVRNVYLKNYSEHFIELSGASNVLLDHITTTNIAGSATASHGIDIDERGGNSGIESYDITIQNSDLANPGHDSTKVEHATRIRYLNNVFHDRVIVNNDTANDSMRAEDISYINNTFSDQARIGYRTGLVLFDGNLFDEDGFINVTTGYATVQIINNTFNGTSDYSPAFYVTASNNTGIKPHDTRFVSATSTGPKWNLQTQPDCCLNIRYLTPETAAKTIQSAIDTATDGETVIILDGTYTGPGNVNLSTKGKAITIRSANGPGSVILDAANAANTNLFTINTGETPATRLDGLTLRGGNRNFDGGAILVAGSSPVLNNLRIENNTAQVGGGIRVTGNANPTILNSVFLNNHATGTQPGQGRGGAISVDTSSSASIVYSVLAGNTAKLGGAVLADTAPSLSLNNCTLESNTASQSGGGIYLISTPASINNSILWNNSTQLQYSGTTSYSIRYSDIQGGLPGTGNLSANPQFVAAVAGDYRLGAASPLVDAGIDLGLSADLAGNAPFDNPDVADTGNAGSGGRTYVDIGAFELDDCTLDPSSGLDADHDGLRNACDPDDDNDGLPDSIELLIGTNPRNADTDGDGLSDFAEVAWDGNPDSYTPLADLNPLSADTDGDGIDDGTEVASGYSALNNLDNPVRGDINDDRKVNSRDVLLALRATLGLATLTAEQTARCNVAPLVNGVPQTAYSDACDAADLVLISRKAMGTVQF